MLARICLFIAMLLAFAAPAQAREPMPIGVIGLSHDHVHWLFGSLKRGDVKIVGIVEKDRDLAQRYADQYGFSMDLVYDDIGAMIDKAHPQAVAGFGPISDHVKIVRAAAPRGVHVMVEKPLALNATEGREMAALSQKHHVQVLTNYETSWYPPWPKPNPSSPPAR
jgi:predicted dehydrogenase